MKNYVKLLIGGVALIGSLWFMGCPVSEDPPVTYSVITQAEPADAGTVAASPKSGASGIESTVTITSKDGYYLDEVFVDGVSKGRTNPVTVILIDKDITVKALFKSLPSDNYKVILKQPVGGTVSFAINDAGGKEYGPSGSTVTLSNQATSGYIFKNYTAKDADGRNITISGGNTFTLPAKDVTVSGVFEKLADKSVAELIAAGKDALKDGNVSVAINAYESAYARDNDNAEALVYSSLGKLASIAWSAEVGSFFKDQLGLKYYPNTLDALINPESWFTYYPYQDDPVDGVRLPPVNVPEWLAGKDVYKDSLVDSGGEKVASSATWPLILIANLIDKNATGLNPALDGFITAVFKNPNFKEAVDRTAKLKNKDPVELDAEFAQALGLSEFFGDEKVYVGWAELELLLSSLKLVKATLLYVDSYNWTYDIGFVKDLPWDESILEEEQIDVIASNLNNVLPLRTGFMTARTGSHLEDSRKAYMEALEGIITVYEYYIGDASKLPAGYKDTLKEYESYKDEAVKVKNAIDKKESFAFEIPEVGNFTINFGKFFTSGQLALDKFIETEGSGAAKSPVFYGHNGNTSAKITSLAGFDNYERISFKIKTASLAEIIGSDLDNGLFEDSYDFFLDIMSGKIAWAVYHWDEEASEQLIKDILSGDSGDGL